MTSRAASIIAIVDDDARVLQSMGELLEAAGYTVHAYPSPQSLFASGVLQSLDCLITDIEVRSAMENAFSWCSFLAGVCLGALIFAGFGLVPALGIVATMLGILILVVRTP